MIPVTNHQTTIINFFLKARVLNKEFDVLRINYFLLKYNFPFFIESFNTVEKWNGLVTEKQRQANILYVHFCFLCPNT